MYTRALNFPDHTSFFLFGPRGVGKTTWLQDQFEVKTTLFLNLLDAQTAYTLETRPTAFAEIMDGLPASTRWVVIDEVQKIPSLLNQVHKYIEQSPDQFFALTGSSARKLKHGNANLLAGRAFTYQMHPFTREELGGDFDLDTVLAFGTLPRVFRFGKERDRNKFLESYALTYLKEEIQSEGIVRNLQSFQMFLPLVGRENGQVLSFANIARDIGVSSYTVRSYYEILEDTLLGFFLPPYRRSIRSQQKSHPKFYLFDTGVKRALSNELSLPLLPHTSEYGRAFEHFWILELWRVNSYRNTNFTFSYFATRNMEIDVVIERPGRSTLFVEIKSAQLVHQREIRNLQRIVRDTENTEGICICREKYRRKSENVLICPWEECIDLIFGEGQ